jgi:hypothetical protein
MGLEAVLRISDGYYTRPVGEPTAVAGGPG